MYHSKKISFRNAKYWSGLSLDIAMVGSNRSVRLYALSKRHGLSSL